MFINCCFIDVNRSLVFLLVLVIIIIILVIVFGVDNWGDGLNILWYIWSVLNSVLGVKCEVNEYGSFIFVVICVLYKLELSNYKGMWVFVFGIVIIGCLFCGVFK